MSSGRHIYCNAILTCPNRIRNTWWGRLLAYKWWISRKDDVAFCPTHVPMNIFVWRQLK